MYRRTYSKKCDGPADAWKDKMKAKIKDHFVYKFLSSIFKWLLFNWAPIIFVTIFVAPILWMIFGVAIALIRTPAPSSCKTRCEGIGAYEYSVRYSSVNPFLARRYESECSCRFADGLIEEQPKVEWKKVR